MEEDQVTAWAIAVALQPVLDELFEDNKLEDYEAPRACCFDLVWLNDFMN